MFELFVTDLPDGWSLRSRCAEPGINAPLEPRMMAKLDQLLGINDSPASWWEAFESTDAARVVLRVTEPIETEDGDFPPRVDALIFCRNDDDPLGGEIDGKTLRSLSIEDINRRLQARWAGETRVVALRERLGERADEPLRPPDRSDPDGFSAQVALRYLLLLAETADPTQRIARETGAPHATAQRWVGDARRRGYLPPARRGRAVRSGPRRAGSSGRAGKNG